MTDEESPIYEPGDVVYGDDPFKGAEDARPWLVISNHEGQSFHGNQYIASTLTTKTWHDDFIEIPEASWIRGGTPDDSRVVRGESSRLGVGTSTTGKGHLTSQSSTTRPNRSSTTSTEWFCSEHPSSTWQRTDKRCFESRDESRGANRTHFPPDRDHSRGLVDSVEQ